MALIVLLGVLLSISLAGAATQNVIPHNKPLVPKITDPERSVAGTSPSERAPPPYTTVHYFDQLIDHNNTNLGTFQQRYWISLEYYGPGGPIILMTPGESNADDYLPYLTNATINGLIAQQHHGATVLIEHRFFGFSNPYDNLTSQSLEYLTIQQAIDDLVYFAQTVDLPMPGGDNVKPGTNSWVLIGGSYAGALTAWTMVNRPGVFRAGYASSAVVEAKTNYYDYFKPVQEYMPQNCSSDVQAVIEYLDQNYAEHNTVVLQSLKEAFGLSNLTHIEDFAAALQNNLFEWQNMQPDTGPGAMFYQFCDALEVKDGISAPASGWGLANAIRSWGSFWNTTYYRYFCGTTDVETCLGTYNASSSMYTNVTIDDSDRSWYWMVCNQVGWYQDGPPSGQPALVSRILQPVYFERQCVDMFPDKFSSPPSPSVSQVNRLYEGWEVNADRLFFANGLRDPWREVTVSADGLNRPNTTTQPIYESNGFHCSDLLTKNGKVDESVYAVQMAALEYMKEWLA